MAKKKVAPKAKITTKKPVKKVTKPLKKKASKPASKPAAKKKPAPTKKAPVPAKTKVAPPSKKATAAVSTARKPVGPRKPIKHVAIAGNIGSGKTTLAKILSKHFAWIPQFVDVENNPYLNDFYEDMPRWSFNLQIFFMNARFKQLLEIQKGQETVIQDRTIYEDAMIFAPNLHSLGLMTTRDFENYTQLFQTIASLIKPPDLLIYLRASVPTLVNQIQKRGREYEDNLRLDYLRKLNEYYEKWINSYTSGRLLIIDVDQVNFADEEEAQGEVINKVNAELYGLF